MTITEIDEKFMREALAVARAAAAVGEVPIGAVVVRDGEIVARAHNRRELDQDPSAHAEFAAVCAAAQAPFRLYGLCDVGTLLHVRGSYGQRARGTLRVWRE